ncbi:unnamed protein product [[Candida] boidinii]|uniref:Unnamed protein product n=1 Tax=Candida boidinii TaxID=5477 RepID=A0A9W6SYT8_CANBO|nr:unnamed protein product [[Candida] boidinii]GME88044.1 unnamed protein product [[Candida] boidinii]GMF50239.1 unnamed protein product [[Candida] boidinii]GMG40563.1 unnamed protein product [[Candida] boidinii]
MSEDVYGVAEETRIMMNILGDDSDNHISTLENNEVVPPPPANSLSYFNKSLSKVREFKENHSGLLLSLTVFWLFVNIVVAIIALVKGSLEWNNDRQLSLIAFWWSFVATSTVIDWGPYCYERRARIWNLIRFQRDDKNHRNTTAADNIRALEAGVLYDTN